MNFERHHDGGPAFGFFWRGWFINQPYMTLTGRPCDPIKQYGLTAEDLYWLEMLNAVYELQPKPYYVLRTMRDETDWYWNSEKGVWTTWQYQATRYPNREAVTADALDTAGNTRFGNPPRLAMYMTADLIEPKSRTSRVIAQRPSDLMREQGVWL